MSGIRSYRDLEVWQCSMQLAKEMYSITHGFPKEELYGLTSQIRRASVSIPANIAEGYGRDNPGDYARFLQIAQGSLKELETLLLLSCEVGIATQTQIDPPMIMADRIGRMLRSLIRSRQSRKS
jgi:four helix bundle protein